MYFQTTFAGPGLRLLTLLALLGLAGCGGSRLRPVEGRVHFNDKDKTPLGGGMVIFEPMNPQEQKISPRGDIGNDGRFQMSTFNAGDGVPEGNYRVYLTPPFSANLGKKMIPGKYENPDTSNLTFEVKSGKNELTITLDKP